MKLKFNNVIESEGEGRTESRQGDMAGEEQQYIWRNGECDKAGEEQQYIWRNGECDKAGEEQQYIWRNMK